MDFEEALLLIRSFWGESHFPFDSPPAQELPRLEKEYALEFPPQLKNYLASHAPDPELCFETVGNPLCLYSPKDMSSRLAGYSWNPLTAEKIDDWLPSWFLMGDEGADPIMVDLSVHSTSCEVFKSFHGEGSWDFFTIAHSIPQLLALVCAQHHALTGFMPRRQAILDEANGFRLVEPAARWYFSFIRQVAPDLYPQWTEAFDNH